MAFIKGDGRFPRGYLVGPDAPGEIIRVKNWVGEVPGVGHLVFSLSPQGYNLDCVFSNGITLNQRTSKQIREVLGVGIPSLQLTLEANLPSDDSPLGMPVRVLLGDSSLSNSTSLPSSESTALDSLKVMRTVRRRPSINIYALVEEDEELITSTYHDSSSMVKGGQVSAILELIEQETFRASKGLFEVAVAAQDASSEGAYLALYNAHLMLGKARLAWEEPVNNIKK